MNEIKYLSGQEIYKKLYEGIKTMNVVLPDDVEKSLKHARKKESNQSAILVLDAILNNIEIAREERLPVCQDTGLVLIFIEQGYQLMVQETSLNEIIFHAVENAYKDGYFRKSVVLDPLKNRVNTGNNLPPVIYHDMVPGHGLKISCLAKGFGSENYSKTFMLKPTQGENAVINVVKETMQIAGGNCCPPVILGVGIGGTMDWAAKMSKKALLRNINDYHQDLFYKNLEEKILRAVNSIGTGAGGLGGSTTALAVHIETGPTHIAGLPVAISVNCWAERKIILAW